MNESNKRPAAEPSENLIGKTFNNGKLKVIGIHGKQQRQATFKVVCKVCSQDRELFPEGYFISTKGNLKKGKLPCGCSKKHSWSPIQWLIRVRRIAKEKSFMVHNFTEDFHGAHTKVSCECLIDGHKWCSSVSSIVTGGKGCSVCGINASKERYKTPEQEALRKCKDICAKENYKFLGFSGTYENAKSWLEYECPNHGVQRTTYNNFIYSGCRCPSCADHGYNPNKPGSFYIVKWTKDAHSFIKFGITNRKVLSRIKNQADKTEYNHEILFQKRWEDGNIPKNIENSIKKDYSLVTGVIDKNTFQDGFTETVNIEYLEELTNKVHSIIYNAPIDEGERCQ